MELELEEVDLGGQEVLEGPEMEVLLYSLVRNCCRMGRRRKLEVELLRSCSRKSWLHLREVKLRR